MTVANETSDGSVSHAIIKNIGEGSSWFELNTMQKGRSGHVISQHHVISLLT